MKAPLLKMSAVKRQEIFEKIRKRIVKSRRKKDFCPELNPDVIVISGDGTLLFQPRKQRALEWLHERYGMSVDERDSICVHPTRARKIIAELKAAGFTVT